MNLLNRLRERARQEGIAKMIQYIGWAGYDSLRCLARDAAFDLTYSGGLLNNCKTLYKHLGANDVYHSDYDALKLIFQFCSPINDQDVLVDVGCGKGRVINYWLSQAVKNRIIGLEIDPQIAEQTAKQFARWPNVNVAPGDAIANLPSDGTLFYFYNPFAHEKVAEFECRLRGLSNNRPVRVVYYNPKSLDVFNSEYWDIEHIDFEQDLGVKRWGRINKFHDLALLHRKPIGKIT